MFTEVALRIEREWTGEEREKGARTTTSYANQRAYPEGVIYIRNRKYNSWPKSLQDRFYSVLEEVVKERASKNSR